MPAINALDQISEHTTLMKPALWLRQIRYNQEHYGFGDFPFRTSRYAGLKAVVIGQRFQHPDFHKLVTPTDNPVTVACDIALPVLAELDLAPTFTVSMDAHPVVANFYRRSRNILPHTTVLLSTTIHRDVVEECRNAGAAIHWIQGFFPKARMRGFDQRRFYRRNVISVNSGGNVATTCFNIAAFVLQCRPIGLFGVEYAWSDETPYLQLREFNTLVRICGADPGKAIRGFKKIRRQGRTYVVDYGYWNYLNLFRQVWSMLPKDMRNNAYNLTERGILSAKGLKEISVDGFLGGDFHT